jgi:hypothetical protein
MDSFQENLLAAVREFEHKFQIKPDILQGHPRTLILSLVSKINELLKIHDIRISFNDRLPSGELHVGKFIAETFQSIRIK